MAILEILTYPDKFLRKTVQPVETVNDEIRKIIDDMAETMYEAPGTGLAAVQVGIDKRIIVYDVAPPEEKPRLEVLINPEVVEMRGSIVSESEGCLSVPDYRADVKRAAFVRVEGLDRNGDPVTIETEDFLSIVLQHEIDHLDGVLFIDRISSLKRELYKRRVRKQMKNK